MGSRRRGPLDRHLKYNLGGTPGKDARFHWFKKGIAAKVGGELETLPNLMRRNGAPTGRTSFSNDIEGHESEVLTAMTPGNIGQFRQIVLETHG